MFIQTQETPNPNSLKFLPGKKVSNDGPYEFLNENQTEIPILKNILSINGVTGIFLSEDFISINKSQVKTLDDAMAINLSGILTQRLKMTVVAENIANLMTLKDDETGLPYQKKYVADTVQPLVQTMAAFTFFSRTGFFILPCSFLNRRRARCSFSCMTNQ